MRSYIAYMAWIFVSIVLSLPGAGALAQKKENQDKVICAPPDFGVIYGTKKVQDESKCIYPKTIPNAQGTTTKCSKKEVCNMIGECCCPTDASCQCKMDPNCKPNIGCDKNNPNCQKNLPAGTMCQGQDSCQAGLVCDSWCKKLVKDGEGCPNSLVVCEKGTSCKVILGSKVCKKN